MHTAQIIYAEDDPNDAYFMEKAFLRAGINNRLIILSDGQQVIDYLSGVGGYANREKHPLPEILLLDLKLPKKTGFEVLEWIKQQEMTPAIKIIVVSSSGQALDIDLAKKLGALDYVIKPSDPSKLTETVLRITSQSFSPIRPL